jgi:N-acetylmuramoyl-L-alanine amidase
MIHSVLILLQLAVTTPPKEFVIKQVTRETHIGLASNGVASSFRADMVAGTLGGSIVAKPYGHYLVSIGGAELELIDGIPFAKHESEIIPLASAPFRAVGGFYIPFYVVTDLLPRLATGFLYDRSANELRVFTTIARNLPPARTDTDRSTIGSTETQSKPVAHSRKSRHLVVVDAGHGGPDNGMTGPIGGGPPVKEKYITLAVARLLADELRNSGVDVLMTRTSDTLIALSDRGRIANRAKGDLFVSIHVNATGSRASWAAKERGYETYFLAEAKTEEASRVERMENEAVKFETGANAPKGDPLSFIINDMAQNEHLRESNDLAETIQEGLGSVEPGPSRGVQQANFAVLRGSFMPAVLVEIGFGTNPDEAAFLSDSENQRRIAANIAQSILSYLDHYESRVSGGAGDGSR